MNNHRKDSQDRYAKVAESGVAALSEERGRLDPIEQAKSIGYTDTELSSVPAGAIMGMGCGNPTALADLRSGEIVLDVGCGGGMDAFIAAKAVGKTGKVIGIDPTLPMIEKARANAR